MMSIIASENTPTTESKPYAIDMPMATAARSIGKLIRSLEKDYLQHFLKLSAILLAKPKRRFADISLLIISAIV